MLNSDDFIKRLEKILDYYSLSASVFADKIGVQRSSVSHLLSGRNKPSLDFVLKITDVFPEVNLYWLLIGKGAFPSTESTKFQNTLFEQASVEPNNIEPVEYQKMSQEVPEELNENLKKIPLEDLSEKDLTIPDIPQNISKRTSSQKIQKIVLFYENGMFDSYDPNI